MHQIHIAGFRGLRPNRDSRLTENVYASKAVDVKLWNGNLRNFPCPTVCGSYDALHVVARSLCECEASNERLHRVIDCGVQFVSGGRQPLMGAAGDACLQAPTPWAMSVPTALNATTDEPCTREAVRYVTYTYTIVSVVNGRHFEYAPAEPSEWLPVCDNLVHLSGFTHWNVGTYFRVYRAETALHQGDEANVPVSVDWLLVGETDATTFIDDTAAPALRAPALDLYEYGSPPPDLHHLGMTDSGVFVGLSGRDMVFTLAGQPTTWSPRRKMRIRESWGVPKALAVHGDDVYVMTDKHPVFYQLRFTNETVTFTRQVIQATLPISALATLATGNSGVIYASTEGLVLLKQTRPILLTSPWFNGDAWRELLPHTMAGCINQGAYILSSLNKAYLLEFDDEFKADNPFSDVVELSLNGTIVGASVLVSQDAVYWAGRDGKLYRWDRFAESDDTCRFTYRSHIDDTNAGRTYTASQVQVSQGSRFNYQYGRLDCEEETVLRKTTVIDCTPIRLPTSRRQETVYAELSGWGEVTSLTLATSLKALRSSRY